MFRTVWLATSCLAMLGALAVSKAITAPVPPATDHNRFDEATFGSVKVAAGVGFGPRGDVVPVVNQTPLAKGDRLQITYVHQERPTPAGQPTEPSVPDGPRIMRWHWHDPNALSLSVATSKRARKALAASKSKSVVLKATQAADKRNDKVKPCNRSRAFSDLLKSLNRSPACIS